MTRDLPAVVARLIPRLGSPFDCEVLDAARAIEYILSTENLDWHDLANMVMRSEVSRRKPAPTPEERESAAKENSANGPLGSSRISCPAPQRGGRNE